MGKGRRYELSIVNRFDSFVDDDYVYTCALDYSGSVSSSDADMLVHYMRGHENAQLHLCELKKRTGKRGNRISDVMEGSRGDETGLDELVRLVEAGPKHATTWLGVKFDHTELLLLPSGWLWSQLVDPPSQSTEPPLSDEHVRYRRRSFVPHYWTPSEAIKSLAPRLTDSNNISMTKPTLDVAQSAQQGNDIKTIVTAFDMPTHTYGDKE